MQFDPLRPENIFPVSVRFLSARDTVDHRLPDTEDIAAGSLIDDVSLVHILSHFSLLL
jgi:hypothetical protein